MKQQLLATLQKYWGYDSFRPFQEQAILSILDAKDTLTVLPTGGGKSVCFQLPALLADGMAVIISPLISLMKDQVDGLKDMGIAAEQWNSSMLRSEQRDVEERIRSGRLKLLYLSPEKLVTQYARELLLETKLSFFVIDEAHCISHWGHNFREDYRNLSLIKEVFKGINIHAFTATATPQVQKDIIDQLRLAAPHVYVGSVDRTNLSYRILPRSGDIVKQITDVIGRYSDEAGIIYCLRRSDVDELSEKLNRLGYTNLPYHAGLTDEVRKRHQDEFSAERVQLMVATIAFGMGIDRSNIRYIIHAAMPKSVEHYQQETGRAGRDGLPADCYLFYSGADYRIWEHLLGHASDYHVMLEKLRAMYSFCAHPQCRHRFLSRYFGQEYTETNCAACDYCLGEVEMVEEPLVLSQKIISCVARVKERFGADHVAAILKGANDEAITKWGHQQLSTFGLLTEMPKTTIRYMTEQLVGQGFLKREGEYSTLTITAEGRRVLKGEITPALAKPLIAQKKKESTRRQKAQRMRSLEGVDETLFDLLRKKRAELAQEKGVPAYIIFSDKSLQDMATKKPVTLDDFTSIYGVGETKLRQYAAIFTALIKDYMMQKS